MSTGGAGHRYPLSIEDHRILPDDYAGPVFVWDIDKTYLATRFSSLRGLARIPLEFAIDKAAIPGMPEVLRGLRRGPGPGVAVAPIYFLSASPPQLRAVLERKMLLDGVEHDGILFKDWIGTLRAFRPGRLWDHVGFKLVALLTTRRTRLHAVEFLFGDDVEHDAEAYALYAGALAGTISAGEIEDALCRAGVSREDRGIVRDLCEALPAARGRVERIFIHLERNTPPERFARHGPRLVPVRGALQLALALHGLDRVDADAVRGAAEEQCRGRRGAARRDELAADAVARGLIPANRIPAFE